MDSDWTSHSLLPNTFLWNPTPRSDRQFPIAVFDEHRYAFYFWQQWTYCRNSHQAQSDPPLLVTIDWHRDFAPPDDYKSLLKQLDFSSRIAVADFADQQLADYNDEQILASCWINTIGDVILLKNYGTEQSDHVIDRFGNNHKIWEFRQYNTFEKTICQRSDTTVFLDIDLDFFIQNKVAPHQKKGVKPYENQQIKKIVNPAAPMFQHLSKKLKGITIAKEPRYCGGAKNSERIFEVVKGQLLQNKW